jgi:hypothetical protein
MALDLFAGIPVSDYEAAKPWYERLLGVEPSFIPHATEAVWELAEHRSLFIVEDAERAGRAIHTIFVDDLDARVARAGAANVALATAAELANGRENQAMQGRRGEGVLGTPNPEDAAERRFAAAAPAADP